MKKILLLVAAGMLSCLGIQAQTWTEPTVPTEPSDPVSGRQYKVKNVAAAEAFGNEGEAFLAGGSSWYSWATSTVLTTQDASLTFTLTETENGWTLARTTDGKYTFISGANPSGAEEGSAEMHVDQGSQSETLRYFDIVKRDNGNYGIQASAYNSTYYDVTKWWGWYKDIDNTNYMYAVYGTVTEEGGYGCDWQFIDYSVYNARVELYNALVSSQDYESVDPSAASAVYNNENATLEEIQAATTELNNAIKLAKVYAVLDGATEDDPRDGTSLIENPDFETGNISGWECTFVSGTTATNIGYQSASYTNGDVTISKFIEAWAASSTNFNPNVSYRAIGDAELQQTMVSLPAGKYKLTCDAIANQQDGACSPVTGVELFATGGGIDNKTTISTGNGLPEHFELTFINGAQGDVTLGLRTRNCTANWIAADNFTLTYYGEIAEDPYKVLLDNYIEECEAKYPDMDAVKANADAKSAYEAGLDEAKSATDNYQEAQTTFQAIVKTLDESVAEYTTFKSDLDDIQTKMANLEETFPDLSSELADYYDALYEKYENGTATSEDMTGISETVSEMIATYVSEHCEAGTDVTILLNNPGFDKNFSGWSLGTGSATPAWGGTNANPNGTYEGNREGMSSGNAEVYHAAFNMYQTIKNMPRGLFEVTCQAFERDDNGAGVEAELYATLPDGSEQTQKVMNIQDDPSEDMLFSDGTWWDDVAGANGGYIPYGMPGANTHFAAGYYKNVVDIVMTEAGDLTIGLRTTSTGDWVLWDDFHIIYKGSGASVYADKINKLITEAGAIGDNGILTAEADKVIAEAINAGEDAIAGDDEDACIAALSTLNEAIAFAQETMALTQQLQDDYTSMTEYRMNEVESSDESYSSYLDEIANKLEDADFETNQEVQDYIDGIKSGFTAYVMYDVKDGASEDAPADITAVIYNPKAVDPVTSESSYTGWSTNPGSVGLDGNSFELYNQNYDFYQVIYGLAPGYYRLHVNGFYRFGWNENVAKSMRGETYDVVTPRTDEKGDTVRTEDGEIVNDTIATPYANEQWARLYAGEYETGLALTTQDLVAYNEIQQEGQQYAVDAEGTQYYFINSMAQAAVAFENDLYQNALEFQVKDGEKTTQIGIRKDQHTDGDWTIFTNWTLEYLGTTAPTGVQNVNVNTTLANSAIYDLTGRRVSKAVRGLYIINGKKVLK